MVIFFRKSLIKIDLKVFFIYQSLISVRYFLLLKIKIVALELCEYGSPLLSMSNFQDKYMGALKNIEVCKKSKFAKNGCDI